MWQMTFNVIHHGVNDFTHGPHPVLFWISESSHDCSRQEKLNERIGQRLPLRYTYAMQATTASKSVAINCGYSNLSCFTRDLQKCLLFLSLTAGLQCVKFNVLSNLLSNLLWNTEVIVFFVAVWDALLCASFSIPVAYVFLILHPAQLTICCALNAQTVAYAS